MNKLFLACTVALAALAASAGTSSAATPIESKYCMDNTVDPVCMTEEQRIVRTKMMGLTKEQAVANRTNFCKDKGNSEDPVCDPKMMNDTTGY